MLFDDGEGVDDVGAQRRIDVFRQELGRWRAILGPVRVVTNTYVFLGACRSGVIALVSDDIGCHEVSTSKCVVALFKISKWRVTGQSSAVIHWHAMLLCSRVAYGSRKL